jgi:hypothetical protein
MIVNRGFRVHDWDDPVMDWIERALAAWLGQGRAAASEVLAEHLPASWPSLGETYAPGQALDSSVRDTRYGLRAGESPEPDLMPKAPQKRLLWMRVYDRDGHRCAYCRRRVLDPTAGAVLAWGFAHTGLWPDAWKFVECHPALLPVYPAVDHIRPHKTRDGHKRALGNLACACWRCNTTKGQRFVEQLRGWPAPVTTVRDGRFDGLAGLARQIREVDDPAPPVPPVRWHSETNVAEMRLADRQLREEGTR